MRAIYIKLWIVFVLFVSIAFGEKTIRPESPQYIHFKSYPPKNLFLAPSDSVNSELLREIAAVNKMGIQLALLALQRPLRQEVKMFANRSLQYHKKEEQELRQLTTKRQYSYQDELEDHDKDDIGKLFKLKGTLFEKSFLGMSADNQRKLIALCRKTQEKGSDQEIINFAIAAIPELEAHNATARLLKTTIK